MDKVMPREIDENMKNLIDTYGDRIESVKDYISAVRKLPGMYNSKIGTGGFLNLIRECGQNCCDQIIDKNSPGSHFSLYYNENTREVKVEDDGIGIPFKDIIRVFTTPHTSKNFEKKLGDYSAGAHGQGAKVANALSKVFIVESYRYDGTAVRQEFRQGYPTTKEPVPIPNKQCKQGTSIYFIPDEEVMGDMDLHWQAVHHLFSVIISLCNIGAYMDFTAVDKAGQVIKDKVVNKDGILAELRRKVKNPLTKPIIIEKDDGHCKLSCTFTFDGGEKDGDIDPNPNITAFANYCPILAEGSTPVIGTIEGICKWFTDDMNNFVLVNQKSKDKLKIIPADIKNGLCIMISSMSLEPVFGGQSKDTITNEELRPFCRQAIMEGLTEWAKTNPNELSKLRKFFKDMGDLRTKQDKEKVKIVQKFESSDVTGGLPTKYKRATNKNIKPEFIIVEGDSALGTAELARDPSCQSIMPIKGKVINAFQCSRQRFFENEEVQAIARIILGKGGYRRNFTIEEVQVSKVIFMADADSDKLYCQ